MKILITTLAMTSLLLAEMTLDEAINNNPEIKKVIKKELIKENLIKDLPLYIISGAGDPNIEYQEKVILFANKSGINIKYNNLSCDPDEKITVSKETEEADLYYKERYGENWLKKITNPENDSIIKKIKREKDINQKEKKAPLYIISGIGKPFITGQNYTVKFAKKFGVNIKYNNLGCDATKEIELSKETKKANKYYEEKYGKGWLKKLTTAASKDMQKDEKDRKVRKKVRMF